LASVPAAIVTSIRFNRLVPDVLQLPDNDAASSLNHAEGGLFLFQRAAPTCAFQPVASSRAVFFLGWQSKLAARVFSIGQINDRMFAEAIPQAPCAATLLEFRAGVQGRWQACAAAEQQRFRKYTQRLPRQSKRFCQRFFWNNCFAVILAAPLNLDFFIVPLPASAGDC
jgi:hypothetical protein